MTALLSATGGPLGLSEQGIVAITVALIGGPFVAWITTRGAKKKATEAKIAAEVVADSVGVQNGHGTVQDATKAILDKLDALADRLDDVEERQHATQTSIDSIVGAASVVGQRLKAHDREHAEQRRRLDRLEGPT